MSKAKTLKKIEQDMESGNEQKCIDALLDAFDYGNEYYCFFPEERKLYL